MRRRRCKHRAQYFSAGRPHGGAGQTADSGTQPAGRQNTAGKRRAERVIMFKVVVILFVAVWALSFFLSSRRKVIRDTNHLLQLILWAALVFTGNTLLSGQQFVKDHFLLQVALTLALFAGSYFVSIWIVKGM